MADSLWFVVAVVLAGLFLFRIVRSLKRQQREVEAMLLEKLEGGTTTVYPPMELTRSVDGSIAVVSNNYVQKGIDADGNLLFVLENQPEIFEAVIPTNDDPSLDNIEHIDIHVVDGVMSSYEIEYYDRESYSNYVEVKTTQ